jgi:hypothetical protein
MNDTGSSILKPYVVEEAPAGTPQIVELHYDVWTLRITLDFEEFRGVVYVDFESPCGFRVLDEGDLLELWSDLPRGADWIYTVDSNGWMDQERHRSGFVSDPEDLTEYFLAGGDDCVSVIAFDAPSITVIDTDE